MAKDFVQFIPLSSFQVPGLLPLVRQPINAGGLPHACFMLRLINASNRDIFISYDDVNDHDLIPADTVIQLEAQTNSKPANHVAYFKQGLVVYVSGLVGGTGSIFLAGYYQS